MNLDKQVCENLKKIIPKCLFGGEIKFIGKKDVSNHVSINKQIVLYNKV